jgi:hypothetical protein
VNERRNPTLYADNVSSLLRFTVFRQGMTV